MIEKGMKSQLRRMFFDDLGLGVKPIFYGDSVEVKKTKPEKNFSSLVLLSL
jgi:hypothetical protein